MAFLPQKRILITGGGRGLGRALALEAARQGAEVAICARTADELAETARLAHEAGGTTMSFPLDITEPATVKRMFEILEEKWKLIDILINNVSVLGPRTPLASYPLADWQSTLDVNLTGTFLITQAALPLLQKSPAAWVLNLTSGVGRKGRGTWGAYAVSKFGLEGFTQVLADELRDTMVTVTAVNPGGTRTAMRRQAYPEEDPALLPDPGEVARNLLRLFSLPRDQLHGKSLDVPRPPSRQDPIL